MNIVKQTLFISRKNKELHLEVLLSNFQMASSKDNGCKYMEVYKSEDTNNEFLFYEEWESEDFLASHKNTKHYKEFLSKLDEVVLKQEILPSI